MLTSPTFRSLESVGPMGETLRVKASEAATFSRIEQRIKKDEEYKAKNGSVGVVKFYVMIVTPM